MRRIVFLFLVLAAAASYADVFRIEPVAPTSASGVFVRVDTLWNGCLPRDAKVTRNGQDVDVLWTVPRGGGCVTAFLPPHAAGPVDVSVQVNDATYTVKSTLRYLDRSATPDEATFERVLIPVLYFGPGAFGSQWQTDATLRNLASTQLQWFSSVAFPTLCDVGDCGVPSGGTFGLFEFGNRPKGLVLFVPRTISDDVHYGLIARDTSRDDGAWGAEVRVVREKDARYGKFVIENVPLDSRYRTTLRIYAIDGGASEVKMSAFVGDVGSVATVRIEGCDAPPCNSADPGFGTFDVRSLFPRLPDKSRITLYIEAPSLRPHWALVSVTNNTTQHVTVISPQ